MFFNIILKTESECITNNSTATHTTLWHCSKSSSKGWRFICARQTISRISLLGCVLSGQTTIELSMNRCHELKGCWEFNYLNKSKLQFNLFFETVSGTQLYILKVRKWLKRTFIFNFKMDKAKYIGLFVCFVLQIFGMIRGKHIIFMFV